MSYRVYPKDEAQAKAVKVFFDALQVPYEIEADMDETEYLLSTEANRKRLYKSLQDTKDGKVVAITLDEIWEK